MSNSTDADGTATTEPELEDTSADVADSTRAPPHRCAYCGRAFAEPDWLALHRGLEHPDRLDESERTAFEAARDRERDRLRLFQLRALAVLVVVYFGFVILFSFFG